MATPLIRVVNPDAPVNRQQAVLTATKEARMHREKKMTFPFPPHQLLEQSTALPHAERILRSDGIPAPSRQQCLGKLVLPFGQYVHAPFHWLVANDVGYIKYVVDRHRAEVQSRNPLRKVDIHNGWIKDYLAEYMESFPQVSVILEANVDHCIYGQKGFEHHTFREMWELYSQYSAQKSRLGSFSSEQREAVQKAYGSVCRWLHVPLTHITSVQMKRFRKYIQDKKAEETASSSINDPSWLDDSHLIAVINSEEGVGNTSKDKECLSMVQSNVSSSGVQSKFVQPTGWSKESSPAFQSKMSTSTVQSKASSSAFQSKMSTSTVQSKASSSAFQSKMSTSTVQSKQSSPAFQSKMSTSTVQSKQSSPAFQSKMSTSTVQSKVSSSGVQSKMPPSKVQSKVSSSGFHSKFVQPIGQAKECLSNIHSKMSKASSTAQSKVPHFKVKPKDSLSTLKSKGSLSTARSEDFTISTVQGHADLSHQCDSPVELEGWVRLWENPGGIPSADLSWVKDDAERGLFTQIQIYRDNTGAFKRRRVIKSDRMWFYPPEPPGYVSGTPPTPHLFFRSRIFMWRPVGVWRYSLKCPRGEECVGKEKAVYLYKSGYHHRVRHICDVSSWYTMLTEVLCCGPCTKAARSGEGSKVGRWLAWDPAILSQLSEAHRAFFPAALTDKRGVDKNVVQLLRDRTEGNTMVKVWRQIQENHCEEYLQRKDLYTTLLMTLVEPGGIVSALGHTFKAPPPQKELPSARLLRHAFLLAEADNIEDYRNQILSTFGTVLKMDSTKKVVKKLSGEGKGTAEWFTSIANEHSQIVSFVLTCEESVNSLQPMCQGVIDRFQQTNQPVPRILYVDRACCRAKGPTSVESLFQPWVDGGMVVRLDIFHWIHRFDASIRTESHSKYAVFKSALAGAVLAYNRPDLELLIKAVRAKDPATLNSLVDEDIIRFHISKEQLKHHVRRVTLGAQETYCLIQTAIDELKGPAGLDESGVSLFKSPEAIDEVWAGQQRHLECIQDPPDMNMYRVAHVTTINGVDVPYYKCIRGSNNLEGFHKSLPNMIPGPHCAARPFQVYLISGIARWNSDRNSDAVFGGKGRHYRMYSAPLIARLNTRCRQLFGETVEENFRAPAAVTSNELLGLEYLFSQSTGESHPFSLRDISKDGPSAEEEVVQPGHPDPDDDEAYQSDEEGGDVDAVFATPAHIKLTTDETSKINHPAFEDACSPNPLPGFRQLEKFCSLLVETGQTEESLTVTTEQRNKLIEAWNAVEDHDKQPQKFNQLYRTHWGNTLYCRTKRDDLIDAALIQRVKMSKRYAPAQQDISAQHNRLMYTLVKLLWLRAPDRACSSPENKTITKAYERIQHRILVEDPVLSKVGIPLPKINSKTVRDFIRFQERLINLRSTKTASKILQKTMSVSSADLPPAPYQPSVLPPAEYPQIEYLYTPSKAGTKVLKSRTDIVMPKAPEVYSQPAHIHKLPPLGRAAESTSTVTTDTSKDDVSGTSIPVPVIMFASRTPASPSAQAPSGWARATKYKRKIKDDLTDVGGKVSRVHNLPLCSLCNQSTQGHRKYKKKNFCPVKMMSSSKGLTNKTFASYEHFITVVDEL